VPGLKYTGLTSWRYSFPSKSFRTFGASRCAKPEQDIRQDIRMGRILKVLTSKTPLNSTLRLRD